MVPKRKRRWGLLQTRRGNGGSLQSGKEKRGNIFKQSGARSSLACITLENAIRYAESQRPLILLTDSKCLLMVIQEWIGEATDPTTGMDWGRNRSNHQNIPGPRHSTRYFGALIKED